MRRGLEATSPEDDEKPGGATPPGSTASGLRQVNDQKECPVRIGRTGT